jgi:hypothetical protein
VHLHRRYHTSHKQGVGLPSGRRRRLESRRLENRTMKLSASRASFTDGEDNASEGVI